MKRYLKKELHLGAVYLLEAGGLYKIGRTNDLSKRLQGIQTGNGHSLTVVAAGRTVYSRQLERLLHKRLKARKSVGEWFMLTDRDIAHITLLLSTLRPMPE